MLAAFSARSRFRTISSSLRVATDRKSTRLNSSHGYISYAVFCLKKKKGATPNSSESLSRARQDAPPPLGTRRPDERSPYSRELQLAADEPRRASARRPP